MTRLSRGMMGLDWESEKETARGEMAGYTVYKRREVPGGEKAPGAGVTDQ